MGNFMPCIPNLKYFLEILYRNVLWLNFSSFVDEGMRSKESSYINKTA